MIHVSGIVWKQRGAMLLTGWSINTNRDICVSSLNVPSPFQLQKVSIKETLVGYMLQTLKVMCCQLMIYYLLSFHQDLAAYGIAKTKIDLSIFEEIPNINPLILKAVVSLLAETNRHDADSEKQRFIKPWIQSNALTDRLAADARVLNSVNSAVVTVEGNKGEQTIYIYIYIYFFYLTTL